MKKLIMIVSVVGLAMSFTNCNNSGTSDGSTTDTTRNSIDNMPAIDTAHHMDTSMHMDTSARLR